MKIVFYNIITKRNLDKISNENILKDLLTNYIKYKTAKFIIIINSLIHILHPLIKYLITYFIVINSKKL